MDILEYQNFILLGTNGEKIIEINIQTVPRIKLLSMGQLKKPSRLKYWSISLSAENFQLLVIGRGRGLHSHSLCQKFILITNYDIYTGNSKYEKIWVNINQREK
eukprot:403366169